VERPAVAAAKDHPAWEGLGVVGLDSHSWAEKTLSKGGKVYLALASCVQMRPEEIQDLQRVLICAMNLSMCLLWLGEVARGARADIHFLALMVPLCSRGCNVGTKACCWNHGVSIDSIQFLARGMMRHGIVLH
jgi:hypothetical protein